MNFIDLDKTTGFKLLAALAPAGRDFDFAAKLTGERVREALVPLGGGLSYSWAAKAVDGPVLEALEALAEEQELAGKYRALYEGAVMNTGEGRMVLHHLLRGQLGRPVFQGERNLGEFYARELERVFAFSEEVRSGAIRGSTGAAFTTAVQIGIGGSDLGPRALYLALVGALPPVAGLTAKFISNVDPDDASQVAASCELERTLFILVSKSGTTQETLANETFVKAKLEKVGLDPRKHLAAVTSESSPLAHNPDYLDSFYIDDSIGGRYSASSAVGALILSLAFGPAAFREFLAGAHEADCAARESRAVANGAMLDALIGVWERSFLGCPATAILPYSQALSRFPAHLQQLDMESNGKRVNREGVPLSYPTGPVIFGEPGTNGQHSFYQLLHQGTSIVPLQFVGFSESQRGEDVDVEGSVSQTKLKANLAAQIVAFAKGRSHADRNKDFPGGRPSSLIYGKRLSPRALGALLAHFENKVMFQGFLWNLNSFDQEGVQLGKGMTRQVLASRAGEGGSGDPALDAYSRLLEL